MQYNLEYHIKLDQSHILPNILKGAYFGIFSQFIADIVISLLTYNNEILKKDINISEISSYYASVASGMIAGFLSVFIDPIALVPFAAITYDYIYELADYIINDDDIKFNPQESIFDIGVIIIFVVLFDPTTRHQYLRFKQKRCHVEPNLPRKNRTLATTIFISVFTSTYGFIKTNNQN